MRINWKAVGLALLTVTLLLGLVTLTGPWMDLFAKVLLCVLGAVAVTGTIYLAYLAWCDILGG